MPSYSQQLHKKILIFSALAILVVGMVVALVATVPLYARLHKEKEQQLLYDVRTRSAAVEQYLYRIKDVAMQVTSRTKAREKLEAYNRKEVGLDEFVEFSGPILGDALRKTDDILGITRLDAMGQPALKVGKEPTELAPAIPEESSKVTKLHGPLAGSDGPTLCVGAPILDRSSNRVGTDIIVFSAEALRKTAMDYTGLQDTGEMVIGRYHGSQGHIFFPLRMENHRQSIHHALSLSAKKSEGVLHIDDPGLVIAYRTLDEAPWAVMVKMDQGEFYSQLRAQTLPVAASILALILLGMGGMVLLLRPLSGQVVVHTDELEEKVAQRTRELEHAREEAEDANQAKSEFLANISHEIRTPMNAILGMTEMTLGTNLSDEQREYLEIVHEAGDSLLELINGILDFSKIEAGKMDLAPHPFSLRDTLGDAMHTLTFRAYQKGLELACRVAPDVPDQLIGDALRLRQIILNLTGNALKFTEKGEVLVDAKIKEQSGDSVWLHFTISDTGVGIPKDKQSMVFDSFSQADSSTTRNYGGTGLGLAISRQFVDLMSGAMWLESEEGKGSRFHFTAKFQSSQEPETKTRPLEELERIRVCIVDDNQTNLKILEEIVSSWNMAPTSFSQPKVALEAMLEANGRGEPYQLALLDYMMPGMDGLELSKQIKERPELAQTIVLVLSSAGLVGDSSTLSASGVSRCLAKPVKHSTLLDTIVTHVSPVLKERETGGMSDDSPPEPRLRILLAEDHRHNQKLAVAMLEKRGHSVDIANNGVEAISKYSGQPYDLVLMEVQMPRMDGLEATAEIRELETKDKRRRTPIVAMTADVLTGVREWCLKAGMDDYLSKPISKKALSDVLIKLFPCERSPKGVAPSPGSVDELLFDHQKMFTSIGEDIELMEELIKIYQEDYPPFLERISSALESSDGRTVAREAHGLRGMVGNFFSELVHALCLDLELYGKEGDFPRGRACLEKLREKLAALAGELVNWSERRSQKGGAA